MLFCSQKGVIMKIQVTQDEKDGAYNLGHDAGENSLPLPITYHITHPCYREMLKGYNEGKKTNKGTNTITKFNLHN